GRIGLGASDQLAGALLQRTGQVEADFFAAADGGDDFGKLSRNRPEMTRPGFQPMRPGKPDRGLRLPFGGHAEAQSRWIFGREVSVFGFFRRRAQSAKRLVRSA